MLLNLIYSKCEQHVTFFRVALGVESLLSTSKERVNASQGTFGTLQPLDDVMEVNSSEISFFIHSGARQCVIRKVEIWISSKVLRWCIEIGGRQSGVRRNLPETRSH